MLSKKVQIKINHLSYNRLEKLANWCWKRYWRKDMPPIARYITRQHYFWEEYKAGLL